MLMVYNWINKNDSRCKMFLYGPSSHTPSPEEKTDYSLSFPNPLSCNGNIGIHDYSHCCNIDSCAAAGGMPRLMLRFSAGKRLLTNIQEPAAWAGSNHSAPTIMVVKSVFH